MAAAYRQSKSVGTAGSATTVVSPALTSAVLAGSRLVAYIVWGASTGSIGTVSDSVNGTTGWVKVTNSNASEGTGPTQGEFWTNPNSAAGSSLVVTATFAAGASFGFTAIAVHEVTGTDPTEGAAALASARSQSSVTNFTTANITPTVAGCYIIGGCSNDIDSVVPTANAPYTLRETTANQVTATEDQVQSVAAAVGASFTFAAAKSGVVNVVAFKPAPATSAGAVPSLPYALNPALNPQARARRTYAAYSSDLLSTANPVNITTDVGSLTLTGFSPTVDVTQNQSVAPGVGTLTLTGFAPAVSVSNNQSVTPGVGALTVTGFAPSVTVGVRVTTDVGALTLTGFAPTVAVSNNQSVTPGVGALSLTGFAPTVTVSNNQSVTTGAGALTLTGFAPTVLVGTRVTPNVGALALTGFAPTVTVSQNQTVATGTGVLTLTGFAPSVVATVTTIVGPVEAKWVLLGRQGRRGIGKSR